MFLLVLALAGPARAGNPAKGMFELYAHNRTVGIGNYITEDFLLQAYAMTVNEAITEIEQQNLMPAFKSLVQGLSANLQKADHGGKETALYLVAVLQALLEGAPQSIDGLDMNIVTKELQLIEKADGSHPSKVAKQPLDYSQFKVRGKYTRNEELSRYFQAMRYAGAVLFPVLDSKATAIDAEQADALMTTAILMAETIQMDDALSKQYQAFLDNVVWLFGPSDDMGIIDYYDAAKSMPEKSMADLRAKLFEQALAQDKTPRILSARVDVSALENGRTPQQVLTGARFFPQHYTPDAAAMQLLVYDSVKKYKGNQTPFSQTMVVGELVKGFPLGLELMALLGSNAALEKLKASGDMDYEGYGEAYQKAKGVMANSSGLAGMNMQLLNAWLARGGSYHEAPADDRRLNTGLAFWTWYRYTTQLYTKQSYTAAGKGLEPADKRQVAWLEPAVDLYRSMQGILATLHNRSSNERLAAFHAILEDIIAIAFKELLGTQLTAGDIDYLNGLDKRLKPLAGGEDAPIVVDVHTEPTTQMVLEEALAMPEMVEIVKNDATMRGALFRYCEFQQPMDKRLNDEEWLEMLRQSNPLQGLKVSPGTEPVLHEGG